MKTLLLSSVLFFAFLTAAPVCAQDFIKVSAQGKKVAVDTTLLRAIVVEFAPGQEDPMHTHPAHFFYALTDGKLKVTFADGKEQIYDLKAGDSGYSAAEAPHSTVNLSDHPVKFLLVELKEHPYKESKAKK